MRLPKDRKLQSQLMMCESRGEQIRTAIPERELMFDAHVRRHTVADGSRFFSSQTVKLPVNVYSPAESPIIHYHILLPSQDTHCRIKRQPS